MAEAFRCRVQTVENIRKRCVLEGFDAVLEHQKPQAAPARLLDGEQEAKVTVGTDKTTRVDFTFKPKP